MIKSLLKLSLLTNNIPSQSVHYFCSISSIKSTINLPSDFDIGKTFNGERKYNTLQDEYLLESESSHKQ